jgi:hypothetical protein
VLGEQHLKIGCEQNSCQWLRYLANSLSFVGGLVAFELEENKKGKRKEALVNHQKQMSASFAAQ